MPIQDLIPIIDDRTYDDIVAEIRTRIPQYTPEWTNFNDSDPGMAIVQLFAWMSELLIFRLGKVPESNLLKFLQLVGIELLPAAPAEAFITFPTLSNQPDEAVIVPALTEVAANQGQSSLVFFETEKALVAHRAQLAAIQSYDGFSFTVLTEENEDIEREFLIFGPQVQPGSALMLGFNESLAGNLELSLTVWVKEALGGSGAILCSTSDESRFLENEIFWEFWDGRDWRLLTVLNDQTNTLTRTGQVSLKTPQQGEMSSAAFGSLPDEPLFWIRARVGNSRFGRAPKIQAIRTNTVRALQAESVFEEVLGGASGAPNQLFQLENAPVLPGTLVLDVDEGNGPIQWTEVEDLFGSGPASRHFELNRTTGEIRFGDGENGRIPVANINNPAGSVIARRYRFGGGRDGNVPAGAINVLQSSLEGIDIAAIANLQAASGGKDEETLDSAIARAPHTIKSRERAVTPEDFEQFALQVANVRRAKALPLHHPEFPETPVPGVMTVIVVPDHEDPAPKPSEGTLRAVCAYLNQRRLLTTEVYIAKPDYVQIEIRMEVIAKNSADLAEVQNQIVNVLNGFLHPLTGGVQGIGWPFGRDVFYSEVFQQVFVVPGVERIARLVIVRDGEEFPECTDVSIPEGALVFSTNHEVSVRYSFNA